MPHSKTSTVVGSSGESLASGTSSFGSHSGFVLPFRPALSPRTVICHSLTIWRARRNPDNCPDIIRHTAWQTHILPSRYDCLIWPDARISGPEYFVTHKTHLFPGNED